MKAMGLTPANAAPAGLSHRAVMAELFKTNRWFNDPRPHLFTDAELSAHARLTLVAKSGLDRGVADLWFGLHAWQARRGWSLNHRLHALASQTSRADDVTAAKSRTRTGKVRFGPSGVVDATQALLARHRVGDRLAELRRFDAAGIARHQNPTRVC